MSKLVKHNKCKQHWCHCQSDFFTTSFPPSALFTVSQTVFLDRLWTVTELKSIASPLETLDFSTDQTVCQQGRFATHLYFVVRGECNAFKTLHHFNPQGACFLFHVSCFMFHVSCYFMCHVSCFMLVFVVPLCIPRTSHSDVLVTRGYILSFRRWAPL